MIKEESQKINISFLKNLAVHYQIIIGNPPWICSGKNIVLSGCSQNPLVLRSSHSSFAVCIAGIAFFVNSRIFL